MHHPLGFVRLSHQSLRKESAGKLYDKLSSMKHVSNNFSHFKADFRIYATIRQKTAHTQHIIVVTQTATCFGCTRQPSRFTFTVVSFPLLYFRNVKPDGCLVQPKHVAFSVTITKC